VSHPWSIGTLVRVREEVSPSLPFPHGVIVEHRRFGGYLVHHGRDTLHEWTYDELERDGNTGPSEPLFRLEPISEPEPKRAPCIWD
jgi:hypothetical protein